MISSRRGIVGIAILFEGGLVLLALGIGWLLRRSPLPGVAVDGWRWSKIRVLLWGN